ncbi:hypothetical protein, partial [Moorena sp. SIO3H5]|uniref:hypothetical protein n=1 Tax=Moorena sp. SIO3H5 TaxID=2607834 RepID=UPI0013BD0F38
IDSPPSHLAVEQASCLFHFQAGRMPTPLILIPPLLFPIPDSRFPIPCSRLLKEVNIAIFVIRIRIKLVLLLSC